jgi:hypothetical protein
MADLLRKKQYPLNYPSDVLNVISRMSFDSRNVAILGSMALRSQLYAGDFDLNETVDVKSKDEATALRLIANGLQTIVKRLLRTEELFIGDIKLGVIPEWRVVEGDVRNGKVVGYDAKACMARLTALYESGVITQEEFSSSKALLKPRLTPKEFVVVEKEIRFEIVRWKPSEVLDGFVVLRDGRHYTLEQAIGAPAIAKLDVVAFIEGNNFSDFSTLYTFKWKGRVLNEVNMDAENEIKKNILYYEAEDNYFKVAKRIFALSKVNGDTALLEKLTALFNSDLGRLYSIISDASTILYLLENEKHLPIEKIRFEIDQFRGRLASIYTIDAVNKSSVLSGILSMTHLPNTAQGRLKLFRQMERLVAFFTVILNRQSEKALKNMKLVPIPQKYLP